MREEKDALALELINAAVRRAASAPVAVRRVISAAMLARRVGVMHTHAHRGVVPGCAYCERPAATEEPEPEDAQARGGGALRPAQVAELAAYGETVLQSITDAIGEDHIEHVRVHILGLLRPTERADAP